MLNLFQTVPLIELQIMLLDTTVVTNMNYVSSICVGFNCSGSLNKLYHCHRSDQG